MLGCGSSIASPCLRHTEQHFAPFTFFAAPVSLNCGTLCRFVGDAAAGAGAGVGVATSGAGLLFTDVGTSTLSKKYHIRSDCMSLYIVRVEYI